MNDGQSEKELIEMILSGGLLEDFLDYLRKHDVNVDDIKSIYDLDPSIVREYASVKNLLERGDGTEELHSGSDVEERYEPREVRPRTQPR